MNLDELEKTMIKALAHLHQEITTIEATAIIEIFRLGKKPFEDKYLIFFQTIEIEARLDDDARQNWRMNKNAKSET